MGRGSSLRALATIFVAAVPLFLSACAVPLGPGYTVEHQQLEVHYVAASPPRLAVQGSYRLKNIGNQELSFLDVSLPDEKGYGRQNLRVQLDGREVAPQLPPDSPSDRIRIPLAPPWAQKQKREIVVAYDLPPAGRPESSIAISSESFRLGTGGWYPVLQPPKGTFGRGGEPPERWDVIVRAPEGFLVHSSGRERGMRKQDGEAAYRSEQGQQDFRPFVVAGRYREQQVRARDATVVFWTIQPLPANQARPNGERIAATVKTYETTFGPRGKPIRPVWIVECTAEVSSVEVARPEAIALAPPSCSSFPEVAMSESSLFQPGAADRFLDAVDYRLARTWFGHLVTLRLDEEPLPMGALPSYAAGVAEEARGGEAARRRTVASLLKRYDTPSGQDGEKPLSSIRLTDPPGLFGRGYDRSELFFFALEDEYGREKVHRALARMVGTLRGRSVGLAELRSALEAETRQNLGQFFRTWLHRPGIPADFRARYEEKPKLTN